jgi:predicted ATP-grasp superfamily ATP-dependent carboligase
MQDTVQAAFPEGTGADDELIPPRRAVGVEYAAPVASLPVGDRALRMGNLLATFDRSVPVLIFKIGRYPLSHGTLGAIRSLGRAGLSVYAVSEDRFVPYAASRYLSGQIILPTTGREDADTLRRHLSRAARQLGRRSILLPTDDEAAVFAAEHAAEMRDDFLMPSVEPGLPRLLASKRDLSLLCTRYGVAVPETYFARSVDDAMAYADSTRFPIVVKNSEPWVRITAPAVGATTIVESHSALVALASTWTRDPQVVMQEYIPSVSAEDWIFHAYLDARSEPLAAFTGLKERAWPPYAGVTAAAIARPNAELARLATDFCRAIGYRGIVDMDWRRDLRDGRYKLVDFNPRIGANFRLFQSEQGVDVVRALHLDLTGRTVPSAPQVFGRRLVVENLYLASRLMRGSDGVTERAEAGCKTEFAWFAADDPLPFVAMGFRFGGQAVIRLAQLARARANSRRGRRAPISAGAKTIRRL